MKIHTSSKTVEYPVLAQHRVTVSADEDPGLSVPEDIVLLQQPCSIKNLLMKLKRTEEQNRLYEQRSITSSSVEYTDSSVPPVVDLVSAERGVAVGLDPNPGHGVVKDLIVFNKA